MDKILVIMGGKSQEYDVSVNSGINICYYMDKSIYNVYPCVIGKNGVWYFAEAPIKTDESIDAVSDFIKNLSHKQGKSLDKAIARISDLAVDCVFLALHGPFGEDGCIQGLLEVIDIPYTGSNVPSSALAIDKVKFKEIISHHKLPTADYLVLTSDKWKNKEITDQDIQNQIGIPCVAKSPRLGSSVGLGIIYKLADLAPFIEKLFQYDDNILIEKFIKGREITGGVMEINGKLEALPLIEIRPKERSYFDYHSKYIVGATEEICPAPVDDNIKTQAQLYALTVHSIIGCGDMSRTDMIIDESGALQILEVNTIPGMTKTSLLPQAANGFGLSFTEMLSTIISNAKLRHSKKKQYLELE